MRRFKLNVIVAILTAVILSCLPSAARAQVNTVNLSGTVMDPQGLAVNNAKVTAVNNANGAERGTTTDANGRYELIGLPPGGYTLTVEATGFSKLVAQDLVLTLGTVAQYNPHLSVQTTTATVIVTGEAAVLETSKSDVSATITPTQIDNLPINRRDFINFSLLTPQSARDDTPSIGAAPTTGLNFGGQRARSNEISIDGADAIDYSVNGVRATVSQEAVQEFQVITSNYMPEYGRAMGGVVNIVTKSGSNQVHGNIFGFLRQKDLQARDPFSVEGAFNPATESVDLTPVKQSYTRVQAGATLGGPIQKDKTFYFFSYETIRSEATGFTNIGTNNFDFSPTVIPCIPTPLLMTSAQAGFYQAALTGVSCGSPSPTQTALLTAAGATGLASATALLGNLPGGPKTFPDGIPLPASYQGLVSLLGNYPTKEGTSFWSLKLDHIWNSKNTSFIRASVSPSLVTGIQVNAENQNFGQNAGNRTSLQQTRDLDIIGQHTTSFHDDWFNEARFQFARRGLHYGYSDLPGGSDPAVNITGYAFLGREPFSTEDRVETRFEWTDNVTWTKGAHTIKFGADVNRLHVGTNAQQIFELNYGGVYDFGSLSASSLGLPAAAPSFTAVQAFGLGIPSEYYQGIGNSNRPTTAKDLGLFVQDSWKVNRHLTLNYGVRYDLEWNPVFPPATTLNAAAEQAFGVQQGLPFQPHDIAPRFALAWDPWGDGKTVVRAGFGLFYDHPPAALAFLANAFDGAESSLIEAGPGAPSFASLDNPLNFGALNASSIFQGTLTGNIAGCTTSPAQPAVMCYQANQQRFNPTFTNSLFTGQNFLTANGGIGFPLEVLPFTIPVQSNFKYAYAEQGNLTIERELGKNLTVSIGYNYTHGVHLDHTDNINVTNPALLVSNDNNAVEIGLVPPGSNPLGLALPSPNAVCGTTPAYNVAGGGSVAFVAPGILGVGYTGQNCGGTPVGYIGTPAVFNFFRKSGPNPSFAGLVGGYANLLGLAGLAGFPTGFAGGVQVPWSDVDPQTSSGNSVYNAVTVSVNKRFSNHFELLSGWTYSHSIDDSTDLSTLLNPQDNSFPSLDRGNSDFDQRHRWITSAVFLSPGGKGGDGLFKRIFGNFTVAPIIELSSGRPYNVLIGSDPNLDLGTATNRPSVLPAGSPVPTGFPAATASPFIKGFEFIDPTRCIDATGATFESPIVPSPPYGCTGDLARNYFTRPGYFNVDLRIARKIYLNERWNMEIIADGFNMLNRFNAADVNPLCDPTAGSTTCSAGQPTAALDPRTFQFALKLNW
ncbi:MAG: TonB-dependent receptor [Candidatus Acidiferrales bacterium]